MRRAIATASDAEPPTEIAITATRVTRSTTRRACMIAISASPRLRARVGSTGVLARKSFSSGTRRVRCALGGLEWRSLAWPLWGEVVLERVRGHDLERLPTGAIFVGLSSSTGGSEGVALDCGGVAGWAEAWPGRKIRASMPSAVRGIGSSPCQERG